VIAELRMYTPAPGKDEALMRQLRDTSLGLFERHGITAHGPWFRELKKGRQVVYVLEFADEQDRATRWQAFLSDPDWKAAQAANEADGPLIAAGETLELTR
jgi:NIPSNAP protein